LVSDADSQSSGVDQLAILQIIHWPYDISTQIGYNVGFKVGWDADLGVFIVRSWPPVHEYITLWALRLSTEQLASSIRPGDDGKTNEILRGVFWKDADQRCVRIA
jgi:hypothetical protein